MKPCPACSSEDSPSLGMDTSPATSATTGERRAWLAQRTVEVMIDDADGQVSRIARVRELCRNTSAPLLTGSKNTDHRSLRIKESNRQRPPKGRSNDHPAKTEVIPSGVHEAPSNRNDEGRGRTQTHFDEAKFLLIARHHLRRFARTRQRCGSLLNGLEQ